MAEDRPILAILGGTGAEGSGLARRWAAAGYSVIIGSRDAAKASETAREIAVATGDSAAISGGTNLDAARACDIAILTVPFKAQQATIEPLRDALHGKILVDVTVPLKPPKVLRVQLPEGGSAVAALQEMLGDDVKVVSAFQNIAAAHLLDPGQTIDCDVLVCGNKKTAREEVIKLAEAAGMRAWHAGPINNSAAAEAMTSLLLFINRHYGIDGSGFRITGGKPD